MVPEEAMTIFFGSLGFAALDKYLELGILFKVVYRDIPPEVWKKMSEADKDAYFKKHMNDVKKACRDSTEEFLEQKKMKAHADAIRLKKARIARREAAFNARIKGFFEYMANGGQVTKKLIETLEEGNLAWNNSIKSLYDSMLKSSKDLVRPQDTVYTRDVEELIKDRTKKFKQATFEEIRDHRDVVREMRERTKKVQAEYIKKLTAQIAEEEAMRAAKAEAEGAKKTVEEVKKVSSAWCKLKVFFKSPKDILNLLKMVSVGTFVTGLLGFVAVALIESVIIDIAWKFGKVLGAYLRDEERLMKAQLALDEKELFLGDSNTYHELVARDLKADELDSETESEPLVCALLTKFIGMLTEDVYEKEHFVSDVKATNPKSVIAQVPKDIRSLYATAYVAGRYEVFALFIDRNASRRSRCLARIVYDKSDNTMYLNFTDGSWYAYYSVPVSDVVAFVKAARTNLGFYFNKQIRPYYKAYTRGSIPPEGLHSEHSVVTKNGRVFTLKDGIYVSKINVEEFDYFNLLTQYYIDEAGNVRYVTVIQSRYGKKKRR